MGIRGVVEELVEEAERRIRDHMWVLTPDDRTVAAKAADDLHAAIGAPQFQQGLPEAARLEHLREALAVVAIALAYVHGRLAWFLGAAATALTPVLHWRAMPADHGPTFGAVPPTLQQYTEAEDVVRHLHSTLASIATAGSIRLSREPWSRTRPRGRLVDHVSSQMRVLARVMAAR
ncbi:hypothetical protein [Streptomyces sp. NPDC048266]|uniref:hypothetical protein n=1 Tax=Streptomyces sp. NPDC048266 TaxID=3155787 RepID=UPI0033E8ECDB